MDPLSQIRTHQDEDEDQTMLAFSPLFAFENDPMGMMNPLSPIQEFEDFTFPINYYQSDEASLLHQQDLPSSFNLDQPVLISPPPQPAPMGGSQLQLRPPVQQAAPEKEVMKKKHHNESERMRRMRLNGLFAALSSVLPGADQMKKHTAPSTVDRVIKYIPQLRKEVETLTQRKQQLLPCASTSTTPITTNNIVSTQLASVANFNTSGATSTTTTTSSSSVEVTHLGNGEISILISSPKSLINIFIPISEVLRMLEEEEEGLLVIDVSASDSSAGRVFYHIHVMAEGNHRMDSALLRKKLLSSCHRWEEKCRWMITHGM